MPLSVDQIVNATGCPASSVSQNWPLILSALTASGINSDLVQVVAAATVAVETAWTFEPIREKMANPLKQPKLAKQQSRYSPYFARGFVGLTWRENYQLAGEAIGIDLVKTPDLALDPDVAASVLAWFFKKNHVDEPANRGDMLTARIRVNGLNHETGYPNGWKDFKHCVDKLLAVLHG